MTRGFEHRMAFGLCFGGMNSALMHLSPTWVNAGVHLSAGLVAALVVGFLRSRAGIWAGVVAGIAGLVAVCVLRLWWLANNPSPPAFSEEGGWIIFALVFFVPIQGAIMGLLAWLPCIPLLTNVPTADESTRRV